MIATILSIALLAGFFGGWPLVPLAAAGACLLALARGGPWRFVPFIALALVLGAWRAPDPTVAPVSPVITEDERVTGIVTSATVDDGRVQRFTFAVDGWAICVRTFARSDIGRGDRLTAQVNLDDSSAISDGYRQYLRSRGCDGSGALARITPVEQGGGLQRAIDDVRRSVTRRVVSWLPGDRGALLAGLVIGDDSLMSNEATDAFARTGTIHVVAVSGSNLALLASIVLIGHTLFTRRLFSEAVGMVVIWAYVLLGGAVPPTLRAGMLASVAAGSRLVGRPADVLSLSVQVAAVQAALWPASTLGLSYRLSTVAIFGVVIATAGRSFEGWLAGLRLVAMTTLVVSAAMLPILPADSRPVLLVSLLTNIAIAPLVAVSFTLGVIAVTIGWLVPPIGEAIALVAGETNGLTLTIVTEMARIDRLPGPLGVSGHSAPNWTLIAVSIALLACVSTEFRRWIRDLARSTVVVTDRAADVATGAAIGALCATVGIVLLR